MYLLRTLTLFMTTLTHGRRFVLLRCFVLLGFCLFVLFCFVLFCLVHSLYDSKKKRNTEQARRWNLRPLKTSCQTNWDSNVAQFCTLERSSSSFALIHRSWDTKVMMTSSIKLYPHPCFVYAAQYHPGSPHIIVTGGYDHYLRVWTKLSDGLNGKVRQHCF